MSGFLDELSRLSRQQVGWRVLVVLATAASVGVHALAGAGPHPSFVVGATVLGLLTALLPDSAAGLFLVLLLGANWLLGVPEQTGGWLLAAALLLATVHLAATLAAYGPPSLELDRAMLTLWARRSGLLLGATAAAWLALGLLPSAEQWGRVWLPAAALVVLGGWAWQLGRRVT